MQGTRTEQQVCEEAWGLSRAGVKSIVSAGSHRHGEAVAGQGQRNIFWQRVNQVRTFMPKPVGVSK